MFRTLLLAPSHLDHTDPEDWRMLEDDPTLPGFLRRRLSALAPGEHEVVAARMYFGHRMSEVAERAVVETAPDAVVAVVSSARFEEDYVVNAVRERWPWVYRASLRLARDSKAAAGGGPYGGIGPRGWLFRLPRKLAIGLIGSRPYIRSETALADTKGAIDALCAFGLPLALVLVPISRVLPNPTAATRVATFAGALKADCAARGLRFLHAFEYYKRLGVTGRPARDGIHPDRATREADAEAIAEAIESMRVAKEGGGAATGRIATSQL